MPGGKPHSPSCERNREPILEVLREQFADRRHVLEIGSGTGEHAVHFAAALPELIWQSSDRRENLSGIRAWLDDAQLANTPKPLEFDVGGNWPDGPFDAIFSANTLHIMSWGEVQQLFARLPTILANDAILVIYGPFNRDGRYSSESNAVFDRWLKESAASTWRSATRRRSTRWQAMPACDLSPTSPCRRTIVAGCGAAVRIENLLHESAEPGTKAA